MIKVTKNNLSGGAHGGAHGGAPVYYHNSRQINEPNTKGTKVRTGGAERKQY